MLVLRLDSVPLSFLVYYTASLRPISVWLCCRRRISWRRINRVDGKLLNLDSLCRSLHMVAAAAAEVHSSLLPPQSAASSLNRFGGGARCRQMTDAGADSQCSARMRQDQRTRWCWRCWDAQTQLTSDGNKQTVLFHSYRKLYRDAVI